MGSLNKVMLIGNLGRDPEIRYTQAGSAVANFSLATTDRWTDRQGQRQERTEWHDIVAFDRLADLAQSYLKKGKPVYIEGRLQTRNWEDQQGQKRYRTEVVATNMQFLDSRPAGNDSSSYQPVEKQDRTEGGTQSESPADSPPGEGVHNSGAGYIKVDVPF